MKKINQASTKIFCLILQSLDKSDPIKLYSEGFMPLSIEKLQENILTPWGVATTYSLMHYYIQNGDLMRDPEMVFIVIDNRKSNKDIEAVSIYPQLYRQDSLGIYEESVTIEHGQTKSFIKKWQQGHCSFANVWLKNIWQQGFLD